MNMEALSQIVVAAGLIEALIEIGKDVFVNGKMDITKIISIAVGILFCFAFQLDALALVGFKSIMPYFGIICTGILASRGSNFISDLFDKIKEWQKPITATTTDDTPATK